jgi:glutamate--cysteine ligase
MPSPVRTLTRRDVAHHVASHVFAPGAKGRVGIEIEWVTAPASGVPGPAALRATLPDPFPGGSRLTFEPGGQLELSGPAYPGLADALAAMAADTAAARAALAPRGVTLVGTGLDANGARDRVLDAPRYRAMEEYFDTRWPAGRTMMRNTASVQVNLDLGEGEEVAARWRRAHDLGPLLVAAFANSPFDATGRATGWCSTRFAVWEGIDPSRTGAAYREGEDPCASFTRYVLDAGVMMIWRGRPGADDAHVPAAGLRFGDWVDHGHPLGHPTVDDLDYHLTTLFPPVRPRGWLELRMIDALPEEWWPVAVTVTTALLDHPAAAYVAETVLPPLRDRGPVGARHGLADPAIRAAAARCFAATAEVLPDLGVGADVAAAVDEFRARYVARGRSPAHDRLDERAAQAGAPS